jgi:hypothetical protein
MRVRMRATLSGTRNGADWPAAGGHIDLPKDEAEHLVAAGLAVEAEDATEENASAPDTAEKAVPARKRAQVKKPTTTE